MKHLILYDQNCRFCESCVYCILKWDHKKMFSFAPLDGKTARKFLQKKTFKNTLILIENAETEFSRFYVRGKAVFRILWLLGRYYRLLGWLFFLPGWFINPFYRIFVFFLPRLPPKDQVKDKTRFFD